MNFVEIMVEAFKKADDPYESQRLIWEAVGLLCAGAYYQGEELQEVISMAKKVIEELQ